MGSTKKVHKEENKMAYLNLNNMCIFEGRLVADPELNYISMNGGQQGLAKCKIKVAVDKNMTKEARTKAQAANQPTADFVPVEIVGPKAEFVSNYFSKGSSIKCTCSFRTFSWQKDGQTQYGYSFDAVDVGFTVGGNSNNGNGNGNAGAGNNNPTFDQQGLDPLGFQAIDDGDLPF